MKLFDEDPSIRWLFCLTHPDDELAICAWMRRLCRAGAEVFVSWTHHTPIRKVEAEQNALDIGVRPERMRFFNGEDGRIAEQMPELWPDFRNHIATVAPDRIVAIAFEQGHPDHDATNLLVHRSFEGPILEYPMYHPYIRRIQTLNRFADPAGEEVLVLSQDEKEFKRTLAGRYPSQNIHSILVWYFVFTCFTLRPVHLADNERMRLKTHVDYLVPNLPHPLRDKVESSRQWKAWVRSAEAFLNLN